MGITVPLVDWSGSEHLGWVTAPGYFVCGQDFCDACGDCMECYASDPCPWGTHRVVVYEDALEGFLSEHEGAHVERKGDAT